MYSTKTKTKGKREHVGCRPLCQSPFLLPSRLIATDYCHHPLTSLYSPLPTPHGMAWVNQNVGWVASYWETPQISKGCTVTAQAGWRDSSVQMRMASWLLCLKSSLGWATLPRRLCSSEQMFCRDCLIRNPPSQTLSAARELDTHKSIRGRSTGASCSPHDVIIALGLLSKSRVGQVQCLEPSLHASDS